MIDPMSPPTADEVAWARRLLSMRKHGRVLLVRKSDDRMIVAIARKLYAIECQRNSFRTVKQPEPEAPPTTMPVEP